MQSNEIFYFVFLFKIMDITSTDWIKMGSFNCANEMSYFYSILLNNSFKSSLQRRHLKTFSSHPVHIVAVLRLLLRLFLRDPLGADLAGVTVVSVRTFVVYLAPGRLRHQKKYFTTEEANPQCRLSLVGRDFEVHAYGK